MPSAAASRSSEMHDEDVDYGNDDDNHDMNDEDRELEAMKARVREMEAEAAKLQEMQAAAEKEMLARQQGASSNNASASSTGNGEQQNGEGQDGQAGPSTPGSASAHASVTDEEKEAIDGRSIYVGNVDYGATPEEIQAHFASCGTINRVTILCDKFTGHPKGYAYVEFAEPGLVANSMTLNESLFRGRLIKVTPKRTNVPSFMLGRGRGGRGRPYRGGRGAPRGGYTPYGYPPRGRGRGRGAPYQ